MGRTAKPILWMLGRIVLAAAAAMEEDCEHFELVEVARTFRKAVQFCGPWVVPQKNGTVPNLPL